MYFEEFKVIEHKRDNHDNVVRITCKDVNSEAILTVDVHKIFYENLEESQTFNLAIAKEMPIDTNADYIMHAIVIENEQSETKGFKFFASGHGLLFQLENNNGSELAELAELAENVVDSSVVLLFDILD